MEAKYYPETGVLVIRDKAGAESRWMIRYEDKWVGRWDLFEMEKDGRFSLFQSYTSFGKAYSVAQELT